MNDKENYEAEEEQESQCWECGDIGPWDDVLCPDCRENGMDCD